MQNTKKKKATQAAKTKKKGAAEKRHVWRTVLIVLLAAALLAGAIIGIIYACRDDDGLDDSFEDGYWLLTDDMTKYIAALAPDAYEKIALTIDNIDKPTMEDVDKYIKSAIFSALAAEDYTTLESGTVDWDDTVALWYRGEVNAADEGEEPRWVEFFGGSNMTDVTTSLRIGSESFIEGFEEALVGLEISSTGYSYTTSAKKVVGTDGLPIVNVVYNYSYVDGVTGKKTASTITDRVDLRKDGDAFTGSARYEGTTLREDLFGKKPGDYIAGPYTASFDISGDLVPDEVTITNVVLVSIVTREDTAVPFTITFPEDYDEALAGRESRWYVVVDSISRPTEDVLTIDEVDYKFINETLKLTYEDVLKVMSADEVAAVTTDEQKKAAVVANYKEYILYALEEQRASDAKSAISTAFWEYINENVTVNEYPADVLEAYITTLRQQAEAEYSEYSSTSGNVSFATLGDYLYNFYSEDYFPDPNSLDAGFEKMAKEQLRQEMVLYYIAQAAGLTLSREERVKLADDGIKQALDYYNTAMKDQLNGQTLTEADLATIGLTRRSIVENRYYEDVNAYLIEKLLPYATFEDGTSVKDGIAITVDNQ